jgi:ATP phosphoribosyltransferase
MNPKISKASTNSIRLALPSKGELAAPTLDYLTSAGLKVRRSNPRQYSAAIPALPDVEVLFQRASDIYDKVAEGTADFGVTGYDVVAEKSIDQGSVLVIHDALRFGRCELVVAVPDSWIDVSTIEDLAELTLDYRGQGRDFRIVTKYPNLTRDWMFKQGIVHFLLAQAGGALEAAPNMGYAEMIVDVTSTGTTLRENRLKRVEGGTILDSQACLIANKSVLKADPHKLEFARILLEMTEASLRARKMLSVTMNVLAESPEAIHRSLLKERSLAGLRGPSITRVYTSGRDELESWYAVNVIIDREDLFRALNFYRGLGATDIIVTGVDYLFEPASASFDTLLELLKR